MVQAVFDDDTAALSYPTQLRLTEVSYSSHQKNWGNPGSLMIFGGFEARPGILSSSGTRSPSTNGLDALGAKAFSPRLSDVNCSCCLILNDLSYSWSYVLNIHAFGVPLFE